MPLEDLIFNRPGEPNDSTEADITCFGVRNFTPPVSAYGGSAALAVDVVNPQLRHVRFLGKADIALTK
jgi:hypothetical protein